MKKIYKENYLDADTIIRLVCEYFKITRKQLTRKGRYNSHPRFMTTFLLKEYNRYRLTLQEIADLLNRQNHVTISYHIEQVEILGGKRFLNNGSKWIDNLRFVDKKFHNDLKNIEGIILNYMEINYQGYAENQRDYWDKICNDIYKAKSNNLDVVYKEVV